MLEEPKQYEYYKKIKHNIMTHYFLWERRYCDRCDKDTIVVLSTLTESSHWFVESCGECTTIERKVHERQTMPFCEECNSAYKIEGNEVLMDVFDTTGKRVCKDCLPEFLQKVKMKVDT